MFFTITIDENGAPGALTGPFDSWGNAADSIVNQAALKKDFLTRDEKKILEEHGYYDSRKTLYSYYIVMADTP